MTLGLTAFQGLELYQFIGSCAEATSEDRRGKIPASSGSGGRGGDDEVVDDVDVAVAAAKEQRIPPNSDRSPAPLKSTHPLSPLPSFTCMHSYLAPGGRHGRFVLLRR